MTQQLLSTLGGDVTSLPDRGGSNSSGVILRNSQKLNAGNFRPNKPYGV